MTHKEKVRYTLRVPKKLKKLLETEAKNRGFTLNTLINMKLEEGVKGKESK